MSELARESMSQRQRTALCLDGLPERSEGVR